MGVAAVQPLVSAGVLLVLADPVPLLPVGRRAAENAGSGRLYGTVFPVFSFVPVGKAFIPEKQPGRRDQKGGDRGKYALSVGWHQDRPPAGA